MFGAIAILYAVASVARQFMVFSFALFAKLLRTRATRGRARADTPGPRHPEHKPRSILELRSCLPMAPGLLGEDGTSVRRRFVTAHEQNTACPYMPKWGAGHKQ